MTESENTETQENSEKKGPRKKSEDEKKDEKKAMINLWMNNLGSETPDSEGEGKEEMHSPKEL